MGRSKWNQIQEAIEDGRIERWLSKGMFEKTIAKNLGVSVCTWEKYKTKKPELVEAIKKGNRVIVQEVEDALFKKALGYEYEEKFVHEETLEDEDGKRTIKKTVDIKKRYAAPDVAACIFILKNKRREDWKNDPELSRLREKELQLKREIAEGTGKVWDSE